MSDLLTAVLAKALVMLVEALVARLLLQLARSGMYWQVRTA